MVLNIAQQLALLNETSKQQNAKYQDGAEQRMTAPPQTSGRLVAAAAVVRVCKAFYVRRHPTFCHRHCSRQPLDDAILEEMTLLSSKAQIFEEIAAIV